MSNLYKLLQLNGGTFPTGGFSQSWGLETYVAEGRVHDAESFGAFLRTYLDSSIARCEGPLLKRAWELTDFILARRLERATAEDNDTQTGVQVVSFCGDRRSDADISFKLTGTTDSSSAPDLDSRDVAGSIHGSISRVAEDVSAVSEPAADDIADAAMQALRDLEQLSNACKVTRESREAGLRMGKAFLRIMRKVLKDRRLDRLCGEIAAGKPGPNDISYPVAYGIVCRFMELDCREAMEAYVYSTANTLVQSAVKLVPLGNTEAQEALYGAGDLMEAAVATGMELPAEDITNFCPGIDIAGIRHETLGVRLYMS